MTRPGGSHPFQETGVPREQEVFNGILRLFGRARCRLEFSQEGNGNRNCSLHLDLLFAGIGERLARVRRVVKNGKARGQAGYSLRLSCATGRILRHSIFCHSIFMIRYSTFPPPKTPEPWPLISDSDSPAMAGSLALSPFPGPRPPALGPSPLPRPARPWLPAPGSRLSGPVTAGRSAGAPSGRDHLRHPRPCFQPLPTGA